MGIVKKSRDSFSTTLRTDRIGVRYTQCFSKNASREILEVLEIYVTFIQENRDIDNLG